MKKRRVISVVLTFLMLLQMLQFGSGQNVQASTRVKEQTITNLADLKNVGMLASSSISNITKLGGFDTRTISSEVTTTEQAVSLLPKQVYAYLSNDTGVMLDVTWNINDSNMPILYSPTVITGKVSLIEGVTNTDNLEAKLAYVSGNWTTPIGYSNSDYQNMMENISSLSSYSKKVTGNEINLVPETTDKIVWTTKVSDGIPTKFIESINFDDLIPSTSNVSEEIATSLMLSDLQELTRVSCKNTSLSALRVWECPKLAAVDCSNNMIRTTNLFSNHGEGSFTVPLTLYNCSNNYLMLDQLPMSSQLATGAAYTYSPQKGDMKAYYDERLNPYVTEVMDLTADPGKGYFFSGDNLYASPFTLKWYDENQKEISYSTVTTKDSMEYYFIPSSINAGKKIHYELSRGDLPQMDTVTGSAITLPAVQTPYAEITDISFDGVTTKDKIIDSTNGKIYITATGGGDVVKAITPTLTISPNATILPQSGIVQDFTKPVNYQVTAENGTVKNWTILVRNNDSVCTCGIEDVVFLPKTVQIENVKNHTEAAWGYSVIQNPFTDFTNGTTIKKTDCVLQEHINRMPDYTYKIGSKNEVGAVMNYDMIKLSNPGKLSIIATATLDGRSTSRETEFSVTSKCYNFGFTSSNYSAAIKGANIEAAWNHDEMSADTEFSLYYVSESGNTAELIKTVKGVKNTAVPWNYGDGYLMITTGVSGTGQDLVCKVPVKVEPLKLSVDVSIPRLYDGGAGGYRLKDLKIGYCITGVDYEKYKSQIKAYAELSVDEAGALKAVPFTMTDTQIIIERENLPAQPADGSAPRITMKLGICSTDGTVKYDELSTFHEFLVYPAIPIDNIGDLKGNVFDAQNPILLGPGFMDMSALTINDLKKNDYTNPVIYGKSLRTYVKNASGGYELPSVQHPSYSDYLSTAYEYKISDESIADFIYTESYGADGTAYKTPIKIVGKKDGECTLTITSPYTDDVLTIPIKVKLAEDKLVWFRVIDGRSVPWPNSRLDSIITVTPQNTMVTYTTKTGIKKTMKADGNGYVVIYEPDGIDRSVEIKADDYTSDGSATGVYLHMTKDLNLSTEFKTTDTYGTYAGIDGLAPYFQNVYMNNREWLDRLYFKLTPNTPVNLRPGVGLYRGDNFNQFAMDRMDAKLYLVDKTGKLICSDNIQTGMMGSNFFKYYSLFKAAALSYGGQQALQDDATKVIVELTPKENEYNDLSYHVVSCDSRFSKVGAKIDADGKTLVYMPVEGDATFMDSYFDQGNVRITVEDNHGRQTDINLKVCLEKNYNVLKNVINVLAGKEYRLNLDTIFKGPIIQSTLFERTIGELKQASNGIDNPYVNIPVNFAKNNSDSTPLSTLTITDSNGNITDESVRTAPLAISSDQPTTIKAYMKSTSPQAVDTITAYKNINDGSSFDSSVHSVSTYYLGTGDTQMKYKWYVSTLKVNSTVLPKGDYFKPAYKITKADGTEIINSPRFEAANIEGVVPSPKGPDSLPFTGMLKSSAFNTKLMGSSELPFDLPAGFQVKIVYDFKNNPLEGTFKMLVGYGKDFDSKAGEGRFASSFSEAMSLAGNARYGGVSKGTSKSASFTVCGYVQGIARFVSGKYKLIATGGGIIASAGIDYSWSHNAVVGVVPVYYGIDLGASLTMAAQIDAYNFEEDQAINGDFDIAYKAMVEIAGYIKIYGGIGFDFGIVACKIGVFGQLDISYKIGLLYASGDTKMGGKFEIKGTIGIEAVLKFLTYKKRYVLCDAGFTFSYTHGDWAAIEGKTSSLQSMPVRPITDYNPNGKAVGKYVLLDTGYELEDRDYLKVPQIWNGGKNQKLYLATADDALSKILVYQSLVRLNSINSTVQENAYPYSYPTTASDNKIMVMIGDQGSSDINNTAAMYSTNSSEIWSTPMKIDTAETTASSNVKYSGNSSFGLATWENIKEPISTSAEQSDSSVNEAANKTEVKAAVYNGTNWTTTVLSNNAIPDMGPEVAVSGSGSSSKGVALWLRTPQGYGTSDPLTGQAETKLVAKTYSNGAWSEEIAVPISSMRAIKSYDVAMMSDGTIMVVYSYEKPGSASGNVNGRDIATVMISPDGTKVTNKDITSDSFIDTNPKITAKTLLLAGAVKEYFHIAWYNEQESTDSQGKTISNKNILFKSFDATDNVVGLLPASLNVNKVEGDPEVTENFKFIESDSQNPKDFGIAWVLPYTKGAVTAEYGVCTKLFIENNGMLRMTSPIKIAAAQANQMIDSISTNITYAGETQNINLMYTGTLYTIDAVTGESTAAKTSITSIKTTMTNTISIEAVDFDKNYVVPGAKVPIMLTIKNNGTKDIKQLKITSNDGQNFNKDVKILPNEKAQVLVEYKNGSTIISPDLTVVPVYTDGTEGTGSITRVELGLCDLEIVDVVKTGNGENGDYSFKIRIRNKSSYKMEPNNMKVVLDVYEDMKHTTKALLTMENDKGDGATIGSASVADVDNGIASYNFVYHASPNSYDSNGLKTLYIQLNATDSSGNILKELTYDTNESSIAFSDSKVLHKEPFSPEIKVIKSKTDQSAMIEVAVTNLTNSNTSQRFVVQATDESGNVIEGKAAMITLEGSAATATPITMSFADAGKSFKYKWLASEKIGFTASQQSSTGTSAKLVITAFGGSGSYEYSKDGGATWQAGSTFDNLSTGIYPMVVRDANTITLLSAVDNYVIAGSLAAPTGLIGIAPTTEANNDGKITGTTTAMEYKLSTATEYIPVTGTEVGGLAAGTYNVRLAAKPGYNAGEIANVVVPAYGTPADKDQAAPTGLSGIAPTTASNNDGKITGTTTAMEYKISTASDYIPVTGTEIGGLAAGTYNVRLAAKPGYNAGEITNVVVQAFVAPANKDQAAPTGLAGVAPTTAANNDGKITGTTTAMEYKISTATEYIPVTGTEIGGLAAGTYNVRLAAKPGYNAGEIANVVVLAFATPANKDQAAPTGLAGVAPTTAANNDGKITGTTTAMEYKISTATEYIPVTGTEVGGLAAGTYNVRLAAKPGYNAGAVANVVVLTFVAPANKDQAVPTGLAGVAPTTAANNDGKITGTTTAMEYKLSTAINYIPVTGTEIGGLAAGTYNVRLAAKPGYNAGAVANVVVPAFVAPILPPAPTPIPPTIPTVPTPTPADIAAAAEKAAAEKAAAEKAAAEKAAAEKAEAEKAAAEKAAAEKAAAEKAAAEKAEAEKVAAEKAATEKAAAEKIAAEKAEAEKVAAEKAAAVKAAAEKVAAEKAAKKADKDKIVADKAVTSAKAIIAKAKTKVEKTAASTILQVAQASANKAIADKAVAKAIQSKLLADQALAKAKLNASKAMTKQAKILADKALKVAINKAAEANKLVKAKSNLASKTALIVKQKETKAVAARKILMKAGLLTVITKR